MRALADKRSFRLLDTISAAVSFDLDTETSDQIAIEVRNLCDMIRRNGLPLTLRHIRLKSRNAKPEEDGKANREIRNVIEAVLPIELNLTWQSIESSSKSISLATHLVAKALVIDACVLYWRSLVGRTALNTILNQDDGAAKKGIAVGIKKYAQQDESKQFIYALPGRIARQGTLSTWLFALSKSPEPADSKEDTFNASAIMLTLARMINEETVGTSEISEKSHDAIRYLASYGKGYDPQSRMEFEQRFHSCSVKMVSWVQSQDALLEPESAAEG